MTISFVPRRLTACLIRAPTTGWFSVGLAPQTRMTPACSMSSNELVESPEPSIRFSAVALGV